VGGGGLYEHISWWPKEKRMAGSWTKGTWGAPVLMRGVWVRVLAIRRPTLPGHMVRSQCLDEGMQVG